MTTAARKLLIEFDALDPQQKQEVAVEILRRSAGIDPLPNECFEELAAELFRRYDAEEAASAGR
jgi:hypothetical protein